MVFAAQVVCMHLLCKSYLKNKQNKKTKKQTTIWSEIFWEYIFKKFCLIWRKKMYVLYLLLLFWNGEKKQYNKIIVTK